MNNVDPTAAIDETGTILINGVPTIITSAGSPVDFSGRSTDPGSDDLTLTWDWDDGPPAPDVSTTYLARRRDRSDPDPSPDGSARDVTEDQTHTFGDACFYDVTFGSADDDGGTGSDDIAVVVVGNFDDDPFARLLEERDLATRDHTVANIAMPARHHRLHEQRVQRRTRCVHAGSWRSPF